MKQKKSHRKGNGAGGPASRAKMLDITGARQRSQAPTPESEAQILREQLLQAEDSFRKVKELGGLEPEDAPYLFNTLHHIIEAVRRIDEANPTGPDEETDPRIIELLRIADRIRIELDPLIRETYKDNPEKLAEWEDIMSMCDDIDEENDKNGRSQN